MLDQMGVKKIKMKIAYISPHYGYIFRGNERGTADQVRYLRARGHEVDIFGLGESSDVVINSMRKDKGVGKLSAAFADNLPVRGFMCKYLGYSPNIEDVAFSLRVEKDLERMIAMRDYDILWSMGEIWSNILCNKIRKKHGIPYVSFFGGGMSAMMLQIAKLYPNVYAVMTPEMTEYVKKNVPKCNVFTTVGGIDLNFFNPDGCKKGIDYNLLERPIVVSSAAFIESKRLHLIIKAMHKLGHGTLIMTSDGPLKDKICALGKKLLGDRFIYFGVIPFESMPALYRTADMYVSSSRNEPYGRSLLECMGCNTPVVAEKDRTRKWTVDKGGVLVDDCSNIDDLAKAINAVYCDIPWRNKPRRQAEKFSWDRTIDDYLVEIEKVLT